MSLLYRTLAKITPPNAVSGLLAWYKSDKGVTLVSGAVDSWADQSGNGHTATAAASTNRPAYSNTINGKTVLTFDGSSDYLTANALATHLNGNDTPFSLLFAVKPATTTPSTFGNVFSAGSSAGANYYHALSYRSDSYIGVGRRAVFPDSVDLSSSPTTYTTNVQVLSMVFSGTTVNVYVNGTAVISAAALNVGTLGTNLNRIGIGAFVRNTVVNYFQGDIAELCVYDSALSAANRAAIEFYLKSRWL